MAVTQVGTPGAFQVQNGSNTPSVAGVWDASQTRTAGNLLIAVVMNHGITTAGTPGTPSGWTLEEVATSGGATPFIGIYSKVAAGGDTAPTFSATNTGTASNSNMAVGLLEFTGQKASTPTLGTSSITGTTENSNTDTTSANVPATGCVVVSAWANRTSTTGGITWTAGTGFTNILSVVTGQRCKVVIDLDTSPSSGSACSDASSWAIASQAYAGAILIIQPAASNATATPSLVSGTTTITGPAVGGGVSLFPSLVSTSVSITTPSVVATWGAIISHDFDSGTSGNSVQSTDGVDAGSTQFNTVSIGTGCVFQYSNAFAAHGTLSALISVSTTSAASYGQYNASLIGSPSKAYFRAYVYIPSGTWVAKNTRVYSSNDGGTPNVSVIITSTLKAQMQDTVPTTMATSTVSVPLDQWFRIEGWSNTSATVGQGEIKVFTTSADATSPDETITSTATYNTGANIPTFYRFGQTSVNTNIPIHYTDDVAICADKYIGPVAAGSVTITPSLVSPSTAITAPSVTVVTNATVTPSLVSPSTTITAPTITRTALATPSLVSASTAITAPTFVSSVAITPSLVSASTAITAPSISIAGLTAPSLVLASTTIGAPTITRTALAVPSLVSASTIITTPSITSSSGASVTPSLVSVSTTITGPAIVATALVTPSLVSASTAITGPTITRTALATPAVVLSTTSITTPTIAQVAAPSLLLATVTIATPVLPSTMGGYVGSSGSSAISGSWATLANAEGSGTGDYTTWTAV
jgi:hypothetical protein